MIMINNKINAPIYGKIILLSIIIGVIFNYIYLKRKGIKKIRILSFCLTMYISIISGGIIFNFLFISKGNINQLGMSSYGGAIGIAISSIMFEIIYPNEEKFIKSSILSLPLIYSISKLACFFAGCCYGIPYNAFFSITYSDGLNIPLLPIQLIETVVFAVIFIFCIILRNNKKIIGITVILCSLSKFVLDFFRYSHIGKIISCNQIISIVLFLGGIGFLMKDNICKDEKIHYFVKKN